MNESKKGWWARLWSRPNSKWLLGIPVGGFLAVAVGAVALQTMNYTLHQTSKTEFCYVCHSHEQFIKPEYEASSHFSNASGVQAGCKDCHLPDMQDDWFAYVTKKVIVSKDIIPELRGVISTREKYEDYRPHGAEKVWRHFKENDSKNCRKCHSSENMDLEAQDRFASRRHARAEERGQTCIDCHYGIVHELPENAREILAKIDEDMEAEEQD
ncbi:MAG: NapC/NirT family cytochrome c [Wenzhouxiangellaceae bacterium]|nr:NapC/NirT family cytochrome c [Wenzhouxiangellaceae bacterium]MBS3747275.1 NapC/NirT family cytochrome c [Wenzhouxiangellaceae bacterium]